MILFPILDGLNLKDCLQKEVGVDIPQILSIAAAASSELKTVRKVP